MLKPAPKVGYQHVSRTKWAILLLAVTALIVVSVVVIGAFLGRNRSFFGGGSGDEIAVFRPMWSIENIGIVNNGVDHKEELTGLQFLKLIYWNGVFDDSRTINRIVGEHNSRGEMPTLRGVKLWLIPIINRLNKEPSIYRLGWSFSDIGGCDSWPHCIRQVVPSTYDNPNPRTLVFANDVQLLGVDEGLYDGHYRKNNSKYRYYRAVITRRPFRSATYPRWLVLCTSGVIGFAGFGCFYLIPFVLGEYNRVSWHSGALLIAGLLLSAAFLFLIQEAI